MLCAATFSDSNVLWHKRCVMLRFVAVPEQLIIEYKQELQRQKYS
jgi:hypothetical protein